MFRVVTFVAVVILCVAVLSAPAYAQTSGAAATSRPTSPTLGFLTSYRFRLNAVRLVTDNNNDFVWDVDLGGDMDVFDLQYVRGNVLVNFEAIVGEQIRAIDPNQGNYTVALSTFGRLGDAWGELGATFLHVSRHLSDRVKGFAVAWNHLGVQYVHAPSIGAWQFDLAGRGMWNVQRSFVDYAGEVGGQVTAAHPLGRWATLLVGGEATMVPVIRALRNRNTLVGSRIEVGVRFRGGSGVGEVFVARERRIDADPHDLEPTTFTMVGFRFLGP